MTTEEKAKAYDEALERARKELEQDLHESGVRAIQRIFPELREGEDERIRKWLLECFENLSDGNFVEISREDILAYLKKRKEQKPILEVFGFKVGDAVRLKDGDGRKHIIKSFEEVEGIHGPNFYHVEFEDNSARDGIYPGEEYPNGYYTQMEKFEEEQKPVEKQDYSGLTDLERAIHRGFLCAGVENVPVEIIKETAQECLARMKPAEWSKEEEIMLARCVAAIPILGNEIMPASYLDKLRTWLKSLPERFNLQPKEEWDEEDEKMISFYEADYNNQIGDMSMKDVINMRLKFKNWLANRLKSLRPSWKPSGWNREDKNRHYYLCNLLRETYDKVDKGSCIDDAISWLEDLPTRVSLSSWKPSEEQMYSLGTVVKGAGDISVGSVGYNLKKLYEQLKKLGVQEEPEYYQHFDPDC